MKKTKTKKNTESQVIVVDKADIESLDTIKLDARLGDLRINMSNNLIRAAHGLTLIEKRIIGLMLAKFDSVKAMPIAFEGYEKLQREVSAKDYAATFGVHEKNAYEHIKKGAEKLYEREIRFVDSKDELKQRIRWVSSIDYVDGKGYLKLGIAPEVYPYLTNLMEKRYTSYQLKNTASLNSIYTWRLVELLMQFKKTGLLRIKLDDFRHAMEIPSSYSYNNIKQRCLEPALKELVKENQVVIAYVPKKKGRKVETLEFTFTGLEQLGFSFDKED